MGLSGKQKRALEKITGKSWDSWQPEVIKAYFAFTDKGDSKLIDNILGESWKNICLPIWFGNATKIQNDLYELIFDHIHHAYTVKCWKEDFRKGLLFLDDFLNEDYPETYIEHAFEIYQDAVGFLPSKYEREEKLEHQRVSEATRCRYHNNCDTCPFPDCYEDASALFIARFWNKREARKLQQQGLRIKEIAIRIGKDTSTVRRYLKEKVE